MEADRDLHTLNTRNSLFYIVGLILSLIFNDQKNNNMLKIFFD